MRSKIMYYVYSNCTGNCSDFYETKEEAQADIDKNITCIWGSDAEVIECCKDTEDNTILWER